MLSTKIREVGRRALTALTLTVTHPIVMRYHPRRSLFDKTTFNQQWIPRPNAYPKDRKPRLPGWSDPANVYPKQIPPLYKPCTYKHYMRKVIQAEQLERVLRTKQYLMANIRSGDIIDITYQQTFENEQLVTHRCYVLGVKRKNSLTEAIEVAIRFGGMSIKSIYLIHGPRIKEIKLIGKSSGMFDSNLKHTWRLLTKRQLLAPRIKRGVMKSREGRKRRKQKKVALPNMKFDTIDSDNVRRILKYRK